MTLTNRDVFAIDPTERDIPNQGVAKVQNPESVGDWEKLDWELRSFVCEGEYERGLERILDQFLSHLDSDWDPRVLLTLETRMEHGFNEWWAASAAEVSG